MVKTIKIHLILQEMSSKCQKISQSVAVLVSLFDFRSIHALSLYCNVFLFFNNSDTLDSVQSFVVWARKQRIDWSGKCTRM